MYIRYISILMDDFKDIFEDDINDITNELKNENITDQLIYNFKNVIIQKLKINVPKNGLLRLIYKLRKNSYFLLLANKIEFVDKDQIFGYIFSIIEWFDNVLVEALKSEKINMANETYDSDDIEGVTIDVNPGLAEIIEALAMIYTYYTLKKNPVDKYVVEIIDFNIRDSENENENKYINSNSNRKYDVNYLFRFDLQNEEINEFNQINQINEIKEEIKEVIKEEIKEVQEIDNLTVDI